MEVQPAAGMPAALMKTPDRKTAQPANMTQIQNLPEADTGQRW